jgi:hypothetical protein
MTKPKTGSRPKAGLGLSSAIGREQLTTRTSAKAATRKTPSVRSKSAARKPTPKGEPNAR